VAFRNFTKEPKTKPFNNEFGDLGSVLAGDSVLLAFETASLDDRFLKFRGNLVLTGLMPERNS
jgi:hypothetical protein